MTNVEDVLPLTPGQQGMLFHTVYAPHAGVYVAQMVCTLPARLEVSSFKLAWQQIVERHAALRAAFYWKGLNEPLQVVRQHAALVWDERDWSAGDADARRARLEEFLAADRCCGFNLSEAPLMRMLLATAGEEGYRFVWTYHHILFDGWSLPLVLGEVSARYEELSRGRAPRAQEPSPYRSYFDWLQRQDQAAAEIFWRRGLRGFGAPTPFNVDHPRRDLPAGEGEDGRQGLTLTAEATAALRALAQQSQLTLGTIVQGAWALLLSRYGGGDDVVFGLTVSGRPPGLARVESLVGMFINALPVRVGVAQDEPVSGWLRRLQAQQAELRQYEYSPPSQVQAWSEVCGGVPLYESMLVFENYPVDGPLQGLLGSSDARLYEKSNYPLTVMAYPGAELRLEMLYDRRRFDDEDVEGMLSHHATLLEEIARHPLARLSELSVLGEGEYRRLVREWNETAADYPYESSLKALFEEQVGRSPTAAAVIDGDIEITYEELNRRANVLAHHLRRMGVGPEVRVGLCLERSPELFVAFLAILKAGGVYVPLDPTYPRERLKFMLADTRVPVLVTRAGLAEGLSLSAPHVVLLDEHAGLIARERDDNPPSEAGAESTAYIIYTSGSTGRPKGVAIPQKQLLNRLDWMWRAYPFTPDEVCCQKTTINFVDSIWEMLGPLLRGTPTIVIPEEDVKDLGRLTRALAEKGVTRLWLVPSLLSALLDFDPRLGERLPRLKFWAPGGEALSLELFWRFTTRMPERVLLNLYGTSEFFDAAFYDSSWAGPGLERVPIGRPLSNVRLYVLDERLRPVPVGVPGQLHVGGAGLARSYLNRPDLTAEKFIPDSFTDEPGARIYRTGDAARFLRDGQVEYLGRIDHQVKIRGFRVEPGEVEAALRGQEGVQDCVVAARSFGGREEDKRLVGYVVPAPGQVPTVGRLRRALAARLPDYMVPSTFVFLAALPLSPNGKVNRAALPEPDSARPALDAPYVAPATRMEETVAAAWQRALGLTKVGANDNFFDLGGHSLLMLRVQGELSKRLGRELTLVELFQYPTVGALAEHLAPGEDGEDDESFPRRVHERAAMQRAALSHRSQQMRKEGEHG
jgi:amino acid adenylation domain-containing protein